MAKAQLAYITPEVIAWARMLDSITIEDAAKTVSVKNEKIAEWEKGESLPSVTQAKKLAKKYRIPYVYFFLPSPPNKFKRPKNADYRTFAYDVLFPKSQSRELSFLLRDVMERRDVMLEMYSELNKATIPFDAFVDLEKIDELSIASYIRGLIGLTKEKQFKFRTPEKAYKFYLDAFENMGILVFQATSIDPIEMRGVSIYERIFPIIVVNRKDEISARIFTMFHELIHIITRTPGICDTMNNFSNKSIKEIELICNRIAAKILVPEEFLISSSYFLAIKKYGWDDNYIRKIANDFAVSREVIIGRLLEVSIINLDFYLEKLKQYTDEYANYVKYKKSKERGFLSPSTNIASQIGKLYTRTVLSAFNQEIITPRVASGYLSGLRLQHFSKLERWCF
ncbi:MAG: ImmA/IrrE family metallo-endopeptidase [Mobilitalea sp.]